MGVASAIQGGLGMAQGVYSMVQANKQKKEAQEAINNFKSQELTNSFKDLQVSTLGADLVAEQSGSATATTIDALQKGGSRALAAGAGNVVAANVNMNREAAADLDRQQKEINMRAAMEDQELQKMQEDRERAELAGLGNQLDVANQGLQNGAATALTSMGTGIEGINNAKLLTQNEKLMKARGYTFDSDNKTPNPNGNIFQRTMKTFGSIFGKNQ